MIKLLITTLAVAWLSACSASQGKPTQPIQASTHSVIVKPATVMNETTLVAVIKNNLQPADKPTVRKMSGDAYVVDFTSKDSNAVVISKLMGTNLFTYVEVNSIVTLH
jgi:hypothetical protein